ncbi:pyridoxamine 5'-phosphate oxidase family protein [Streptacidiphilus pinicola]|uniref:pyridoxamine 5'-phosphate oxidase family protein n=1 Tax=Streptacidiphilus pinicola TaxID=2219663 RepID=UPI001FB3C6B3|nr:pyridoxamine 5'-phosphate oxidase family protein [Streptacidiphilus pinicola]
MPLSTEEAMRLLAGAPFGRIVFTEHALPAIRLVNHALVDGRIMIRTHRGAALTAAVPAGPTAGAVVVYEADDIDAETRSGWSVTVTGYARLLAMEPEGDAVWDPAGQEQVPEPWFDAEMTHLVVIQPEIVAGVRLIAVS